MGTIDEKHREKAIETRSRHSKAVNVRNVIRERREQGQIADKAHAIRNHCLECVGYNNEEVKLCTSVRCWLYPWRLGHLDEECVE